MICPILRAYIPTAAILCLLLALFLAAGCERFPTADEIDDQLGHPEAPLRHDAPTCGGAYFYRTSTWTPASDSGATCSDGRDPIPVGYAVAPLDGSCEKGIYTLNNFRQLYGCRKGAP